VFVGEVEVGVRVEIGCLALWVARYPDCIGIEDLEAEGQVTGGIRLVYMLDPASMSTS
jgi:hypothetical protein